MAQAVGSTAVAPAVVALSPRRTRPGATLPCCRRGGYCSLSDSGARQAFLRTLRSVVDYRGQAVSALNKLHLTADLPTLLIWGDRDRIIPV